MANILLTMRLLMVAGLVSLCVLTIYSITTGDYIWLLVSIFVYKIVGLLSNQIALHRYFSHCSFKTTPARHKFLCYTSLLVGQGSPITYAGGHRQHHIYSDTVDDIHSPLYQSWLKLFLFNFLGTDAVGKPMVISKDLIRDPTVSFIHRHYGVLWLMLIVVSATISFKFLFFIVLANVGWNVIHMTLFRIILVHTKLPGSYRNFETTDYSWNNHWLQIIDIGEGLHNNHHKYPNKYDQAMTPNEFDPAGWIISRYFAVDNN